MCIIFEISPPFQLMPFWGKTKYDLWLGWLWFCIRYTKHDYYDLCTKLYHFRDKDGNIIFK